MFVRDQECWKKKEKEKKRKKERDKADSKQRGTRHKHKRFNLRKNGTTVTKYSTNDYDTLKSTKKKYILIMLQQLKKY